MVEFAESRNIVSYRIMYDKDGYRRDQIRLQENFEVTACAEHAKAHCTPYRQDSRFSVLRSDATNVPHATRPNISRHVELVYRVRSRYHCYKRYIVTVMCSISSYKACPSTEPNSMHQIKMPPTMLLSTQPSKLLQASDPPTSSDRCYYSRSAAAARWTS